MYEGDAYDAQMDEEELLREQGLAELDQQVGKNRAMLC